MSSFRPLESIRSAKSVREVIRRAALPVPLCSERARPAIRVKSQPKQFLNLTWHRPATETSFSVTGSRSIPVFLEKPTHLSQPQSGFVQVDFPRAIWASCLVQAAQGIRATPAIEISPLRIVNFLDRPHHGSYYDLCLRWKR